MKLKSYFMKKLLLFAFAIIVGNSFAQKTEYKYINNFLSYNNYMWNTDKKKVLVSENNVASVALMHENYSKKGKVKSKKINSLLNFNHKGEIVNSIFYSTQNKPVTTTFTYDENNFITSQTQLNKKGKILNKTETSFYSKIQYKEVKIYKKGGKDIKQRVAYTVTGDLLTQTDYYKNDKKYQTWKYEYGTDKKLSKTLLYNSKGKIIYTWLHDCKPEGELVSMKNKDTALVCRKVEINPDGSFVKTVINTQDDKIVTEVMTFSKDSILLSNLTYNKDQKLISKAILNNKYSNTYEYDSYNKKSGLIHYSYKTESNDNGFQMNNTYTFYNKNGTPKRSFTDKFSYNQFSLPEKVEHAANGTKTYCELYEYSYKK